MASMKIVIEKVNMGYWLVDCPECGTVGVWPKRWAACLGRDAHIREKHESS